MYLRVPAKIFLLWVACMDGLRMQKMTLLENAGPLGYSLGMDVKLYK